MKLKLGIHVHAKDFSLYINCDLCSGQIRTLVAMATYIFYRLITGKLKIDIFSVQWVYLEFIFAKMFNE